MDLTSFSLNILIFTYSLNHTVLCKTNIKTPFFPSLSGSALLLVSQFLYPPPNGVGEKDGSCDLYLAISPCQFFIFTLLFCFSVVHPQDAALWENPSAPKAIKEIVATQWFLWPRYSTCSFSLCCSLLFSLFNIFSFSYHSYPDVPSAWLMH